MSEGFDIKIVVRIPPYRKRIRQAAELRTMLSQQRWGPVKQITRVT